MDVFEFNYPLEKAYWAAYLNAVESAVDQEAGQAVEDLLAIGRQAGTARVVEGLMQGEVWRSSSMMPYPDYFAQDWAEANFFSPLSQFVGGLVNSVFN